MKAKNGISLIVLVITIVVIIILAAAVILSLGQNNPINTSRVASLTQTRDNLESAISIHLSNEFAKCQGAYASDDILKGVSDATEGAYNVAGVVDTTAGSNIGDFYKVKTDSTTKTKLGLELKDDSAEVWYINIKTGKAQVKIKDAGYLHEDGDTAKTLVSTVAGWVVTQ